MVFFRPKQYFEAHYIVYDTIRIQTETMMENSNVSHSDKEMALQPLISVLFTLSQQ